MENIEVDNGENIPKDYFDNHNSIQLSLSSGNYVLENCNKDHLILTPYRGLHHYNVTIKNSDISYLFIKGGGDITINDSTVNDLNISSREATINNLKVGEAGINIECSELDANNIEGDYCSILFTLRKTLEVNISNVNINHANQIFNLHKCHSINACNLKVNECKEFIHSISDRELDQVNNLILEDNEVEDISSLINNIDILKEGNINIVNSPSLELFLSLDKI